MKNILNAEFKINDITVDYRMTPEQFAEKFKRGDKKDLQKNINVFVIEGATINGVRKDVTLFFNFGKLGLIRIANNPEYGTSDGDMLKRDKAVLEEAIGKPLDLDGDQLYSVINSEDVKVHIMLDHLSSDDNSYSLEQMTVMIKHKKP